ncbi:cation:proton antiporter domain-containing protein [Streptomyces specialis]|uniref:cation:proton antiporter domain-containing protein n=1 Tax=Streptomyces specialis TaxID=498367 RepID=UPI00099ED993|nr:cation:proton antiporter [Streptomyces specialis]
MDQLSLLFVLLFGAVLTVPLGERLSLPPPVLMTVAGILVAFLPFVPEVDLPPEYILPLVLPPVLYAAVQRTSWRQFTANVRPILLLAVALVFVTTAAVAVVAQAAVPGLPLAPAIALGALVAPPDPVAATAVAGRLGLPRRMVSILEGEGLFNDVTAITLYHVAVTAAVTGSFSATGAGAELALSAGVALAVGAVVGWATTSMFGLLGDVTLRTGLTLLAPFAAYVLAEELSGSGVLAVLVTALWLGERGADADDVTGRLTGRSFWAVIDTLVTGVAFGLIGLELHLVLDTVSGRWGELLPAAALVLAVVVAVRLLWLLPATWLARRLHRRTDYAEEIPLTWRETVVMWWSGMRGVASVAENSLARYEARTTDLARVRQFRTQLAMLRRVVTPILTVVAVAVTILLLFPNLRALGTSMLASAGVIGVIAGVAAQSMLSNLFAGLQIAFGDSVKIGDTVVVDGEWGTVEEMSLAFLTVRIWDDRRLTMPVSYFNSKPYENWSRGGNQITGTVFIHLDHTTPVPELRKHLGDFLTGRDDWDRRHWDLVVTDTTPTTIQVRASMSTRNADDAWSLRCAVREELIAWLRDNHPYALPRVNTSPAEVRPTDTAPRETVSDRPIPGQSPSTDT